MCTVLRRGKEGEKGRNEVGDEEFVTCCDSFKPNKYPLIS